MSAPYFRGVIDETFDWTNPGFYEINASSFNTIYFPRANDIITLSAFNENIRCWPEWDSSNQRWKIYVSDMSFVGKVYYRLQSSAIDRTKTS